MIEDKVSTDTKFPEQGQEHVGRSVLALVDRLLATVPEEERRLLPPDLSENLDHYLYGTPKHR
jgi:hypothetical protein